VFAGHATTAVYKSRSPGRMATKYCTMAPNICGSSVWTILHVALLALRILRWLLDFWEVCAPLLYQQMMIQNKLA